MNKISLLFNSLLNLVGYKLQSINEFTDTDKFIDTATIVSVTDEKGKITYVNEKFEKISGWKLEEVKGKDHSIVNSGLQPDGY
jgi:PAS domain-containing protein